MELEPKYIRRGDIWKLKSYNPDYDKYVVVFLLKRNDDPYGPDRRVTSWEAVVVGGNHPSYPVYGYDIVVSNADILERGEKINL